MLTKRPYFYKTIAELERLVDQEGGKQPALESVLDELKHRDTDRAARLRRRIGVATEGRETPKPVGAAPLTLIQLDQATVECPANSTDRLTPDPVQPENRPEVRKMPRKAGVHGALENDPASEPGFGSAMPQPGATKTTQTPQAPRSNSGELIEEAMAATSPQIVSRMIDLIDYVVSVEKDKLKIVTDVADHRAFNRNNVQLAELPGVRFNTVDGDEVSWLSVERLTPVSPPAPEDETLKVWLVLFDDPSRQPRLRESVSSVELQMESELEPRQNLTCLNDFANQEAVGATFDSYVDGPWSKWAGQEAPRRETIALYGSLFALQSALSVPDGTPQEFVCGIGYAALARDGKRLSYPLLTVPLEIEMDHKSHIISIVPREELQPTVETDALDVLQLKQVGTWSKDTRRVLDALEDAPLSPYFPEAHESILRQAAALLDPQARYEDGDGKLIAPPTPGPELIITNSFGFFQRERRATQLMADLLGFRALLENRDELPQIPGAIAALFTEPSVEVADENFPTFRGINSIPGVTSSNGVGDDLFFPKPFNGEQVQIAQRLAVRDGVVVQGPPGTGKTHTIANIISHYLATGKRVLVTSQKSPALQVLQEQLPEPIRPLAVSLLDSDREGLRQFRASVDLIAERLQGLRRSELDNEIASLDNRIDGLHRTLANIDRQIEMLGRNALTPVTLDEQIIRPLDAAKEVLEAGEDAWWIEDAITPDPRYTPCFNNDDIAACRVARSALGELLGYLGKSLPPAELFADTEAIVATHTDLAKAAAIKRKLSSGSLWFLVDESLASEQAAVSLHEQLSEWTLRRDALSKSLPSWDAAIELILATPADPVLLALQGLTGDAKELAEDHAWFMTRPVEFPAEALNDPRFVAAIEDLQGGGSGLGGLAGLFARRTKQSLAGVRLRGRPPRQAEDWQAVARHVRSRERAAMFTSSWNHACEGTDLPRLPSVGPASGMEALRVLNRLNDLSSLHTEALILTKQIRKLLPQWPGTIERHLDTGSTLYCLKLHLDRTNLAKAEANRCRLLAGLGSQQTSIHEDARAYVSNLGTESLSATDCQAQLIALVERIDHLHGLHPQFERVQEVCEKIASSGAVGWAGRLYSVAAKGEDALCPGDWRRRWRLRQLASWLDASQKLDAFRTLHSERQNAEGDLSRSYTRLIEQRTWRELKKQASPAVMTALSAYAVAVGRIGKGTGKSATRHRRTARHAANAVKGALPCWIMPHHRVSESLPAELGIFDLVIVDEASQSTLSALPALFRARQILVVGDDKQVSPDNVGLAMDQANARAARFLTSQVALFRAPMRQEASLYDLASVVFGGDNLMLREHFRCAAPIIEFSKRQFYRNELRPLRLSKPSERLDPVLIDVRVTDGYRKGKINPPEADFIVSELQRMGEDPAFEGRTFGVTTLLGTEQAALIYKKVEAGLGIPFIEQFKLRVGDPAAFQGDERDVMFLSMVVTAGNATALSGLGYEQRFNVAASRARERMILVRSIELEELSPRDALRRALLEHFRSPFPIDAVDTSDARNRCESDFERDMFDMLAELGFSVDTQVKVGGHRIDMVVEGEDDRRLAIECDGDRYHGPEQWPADMARQRTLERAGWRIWRCFASRFVRERPAVLGELTELLDTMDIQPRKASERSRTYTELREWNSAEVGSQLHQTLEPGEDNRAHASGNTPSLNNHTAPIFSAGKESAASERKTNDHKTEQFVRVALTGTDRVGEAHVQTAILALLADGKAWTNAELKRRIPSVLSLSPADRVLSPTRPKEEKWEELVNNALSQSGRSNSLYAKGLVSKVGFGLHKLADPPTGSVEVRAAQSAVENNIDDCSSVSGMPQWVKIVGFLEHNWALIEDRKRVVLIWFIDDKSGVFDRVEFRSMSDAESALTRNGFRPKKLNSRLENLAPAPPFTSSPHPNGKPYSSGRYWHE